MILLLLGWVLIGSRPAQAADALEEGLTAARKQFLAALEAVVTWCSANNVHRERDAVYATILRLAPEHARARAALKYTRHPKTKAWRQPDYVAPKNFNLGLVPEARRRRDEAQAPYRDAVLQAVDAAGEGLESARREALLERLLDLMPQDETLRLRLGHVQHEGRWLLPESLAGIQRRRELLEARVRGDELSREPTKPNSLGGAEGARAGNLAAWATASRYEGDSAVETMQQAELMGRVALGLPPQKRLAMSVLLLTSREEARAYLARDPEVGKELLATLDEVASVWTPGGMLLGYASTPARRESGVMRQAVSLVLRHMEHGDQSRGWISEGLGQRICWLGFGSHGPPFIAIERTEAKGGEEDDEREQLPPDNVSWLPAAAALLDADPVPVFSTLLTRRLNAMGVSDVLASYALAAYLLEGRAGDLAGMVKASTTLDDPDAQAREALGADLATLAWRVRRWVMEAEGV